MTTRDPGKRKTTPRPSRSKPIRHGAGVRSSAAPAQDPEGAAASLDEAVAQAVQSSYDVLDEAVRQSRTATDRFREGDLSLTALPVDVASISLKAIDIARQMSKATLDLCEQLVLQINTSVGPPPPGEVAAKVPPFRKTMPDPPSAAQPHGSAAAPTDDITFETHFTGGGKAITHTRRMSKPAQPKEAKELAPLSLLPTGFKAKGLECGRFSMDLGGTLSVTVNVPKRQKPGIYSGLIMANGQDLPLGVMSVEVLKSA